jgi:hypothetical protein
MKHKLLVVVLILAVFSTLIVMDAQAFVQDGLARSGDVAVQQVYMDSTSKVIGTSFQVGWRSGIRMLRFRMV